MHIHLTLNPSTQQYDLVTLTIWMPRESSSGLLRSLKAKRSVFSQSIEILWRYWSASVSHTCTKKHINTRIISTVELNLQEKWSKYQDRFSNNFPYWVMNRFLVYHPQYSQVSFSCSTCVKGRLFTVSSGTKTRLHCSSPLTRWKQSLPFPPLPPPERQSHDERWMEHCRQSASAYCSCSLDKAVSL